MLCSGIRALQHRVCKAHSFFATLSLKNNQKGITAIEYAALAIGLAALIGTLTQEGGVLRKALEEAFNQIPGLLQAPKG